jgi:hypothetical protein
MKIGSDLLISQLSPAKAALGEKTARCTNAPDGRLPKKMAKPL